MAEPLRTLRKYSLPTKAELRALLRCDKAGVLKWRRAPSPRVRPGDEAGSRTDGRLRIKIGGVRFDALRIKRAMRAKR